MNPYGLSVRNTGKTRVSEHCHVQVPGKVGCVPIGKADSISSDEINGNRKELFFERQKPNILKMGSLMGSKLLGNISAKNFKQADVPMAGANWDSFIPLNSQEGSYSNSMNDRNNQKCCFRFSDNWNSPCKKIPMQNTSFHQCIKNCGIDLIPALRNCEKNTRNNMPDYSQNYKKMHWNRKKSNRYQRYGWIPKPTPAQAGSGTSVPDKNQGAGTQTVSTNAKKCDKKPKSPTIDTYPSEVQTVPCKLSNLSLGESMAIENARKLNSAKCEKSSQENGEDQDIDWFSVGEEKVEKEQPSVCRQESSQCSDADSFFGDDANFICQEVRDLFDCEESQDFSKNERTCKLDEKKEVQMSEKNPTCVRNASDSHGKVADVPKESKCPATCENNTNDSKDLSFLLFIRNNNKKCRPSSKKRKRSKARKESSENQTPQSQSQKPQKESNHDVRPGANSIAFILGFNTNKDQVSSAVHRTHSFLVSFSDSDFDSSEDSDNDSDWSEDETDGVDLFTYPEFSSPLNFNVICSVQQAKIPQEASQESLSPELDAVNAAWRINCQIPVDSSQKTCRDSNKKVHFANDESLVTDVAVVENWCRKGPWEEFARDRERFRRRIAEMEPVIGPVLQPETRQKYYETVVLND